jgi:transcriptional regulator with XRE-family HTH domain
MSDTGVGALLRRWRTARQLSQLELSQEAEISTRHVSFIETGRSRPSREMVLLLASVLDVPLRERNALLQAAGFAPAYRETGLDDPAMANMREAVRLILGQHEPCPALAVDRHWSLVMANAPYARFLRLLLGEEGTPVPPYEVLPEPRLNTLLPLFDPALVRPHVRNWEEVARTLLRRVRREAALEGDRRTEEILDRLAAFPGVKELAHEADGLGPQALVIPVELDVSGTRLRFFSTVTTLGAPQDITLAELRIEAMHAADAQTEEALRAMASADPTGCAS